MIVGRPAWSDRRFSRVNASSSGRRKARNRSAATPANGPDDVATLLEPGVIPLSINPGMFAGHAILHSKRMKALRCSRSGDRGSSIEMPSTGAHSSLPVDSVKSAAACDRKRTLRGCQPTGGASPFVGIEGRLTPVRRPTRQRPQSPPSRARPRTGRGPNL